MNEYLEWLENLLLAIIRDAIWRAIQATADWAVSKTEKLATEYLKKLKPGEDISKKDPLVKVMVVDEGRDEVTLQVRGSFTLSGVTPFLRVMVTIPRAVKLDKALMLTGVRIGDVIGDLEINKGPIDAELGVAVEKGVMIVSGILEIKKTHLRFAVLGGKTEHGLLLGLDVKLPKGAAIPIAGPIGLQGVGGDYAHNFQPRVEKDGVGISAPTSRDYVDWARSTLKPVERWVVAPPGKTTTGLAIRTVLVTMNDGGTTFEIDPAGFAFISPSVFILGGKVKILSRESISGDAYLAVDFSAPSLSLGAGLTIDLRTVASVQGGYSVLKGHAQITGYFPFANGGDWFLDIGTKENPVSLEVLSDVPLIADLASSKAESYLQINAHRLQFGAKLTLGWEFKASRQFRVGYKVGLEFAGYLGWNPLLISAMLAIYGEAGVTVFGFTIAVKVRASAQIYLPQPLRFMFTLGITLDLPFPLPDPYLPLSVGKADTKPPEITGALGAGDEVLENGGKRKLAGQVAAVHPLTGTTTELPGEPVWPDAAIAVPFTIRTTDETGHILGLPIDSNIVGGYEVAHRLTRLDLTDLGTNQKVTDLQAIWVQVPGSETSQLRIGSVYPTGSFSSSAPETTAPEVEEVDFGHGPDQQVDPDTRFATIRVQGGPGTRLTNDFAAKLPTRILRTDTLRVEFRGLIVSRDVDQVVVFHLSDASAERVRSTLRIDGRPADTTDWVREVSPGVTEYASTFTFAQPVGNIVVRSSAPPLLVRAIRYRAAATPAVQTPHRAILLPRRRYRLDVEGQSTAVHPEFAQHKDLYPSAPQVDWNVSRELEVIAPPTILPYVAASSLGDNRIHRHAAVEPWSRWTLEDWNESPLGVGFPAYRRYPLSIRFLVPDVQDVFGVDKFAVQAIWTPDIAVQTISAATGPAADGASSMKQSDQIWITSHGAKVAPDAELIVPIDVSPGPVQLNVLADGVVVGTWTGTSSQFERFRDHVARPDGPIGDLWSPVGRRAPPACPEPSPAAGGIKWRPIEYSDVAPGRELPAVLAEHLGPLDYTASVRFLRFAQDSDVDFRDGGDDIWRIAGAVRPVDTTRLDALADDRGAVIALWLRTPEAVDWRRVTATASVRHLTGDADCAPAFDNRTPLDLDFGILPSPGGSAAFLVGRRSGKACELPRGVYDLSLTFDGSIPALPPVALPTDEGTSETAHLAVTLADGRNWPTQPIEFEPFNHKKPPIP